MTKKWYRSKTIWTGVTAIVGAVAAAMTGEIEVGTALQTVVVALVGIFLREGVGKPIR